MESKSLSIKKGALLVVLSTLVIAGAQVFLKKGAGLIEGSVRSVIFNPWIISGFVFYGLATLLLMTALKTGDLNSLYPIVGLGYVWVCILSFFLFKEAITKLDTLGIIFIVFGVAILGADKNTNKCKGVDNSG
jgi:multidrug transporter EmrE-like cation transporter